MKFPTVVIFTGLFALGSVSAAVTKPTPPPIAEAAAKSLDSMIGELADQNFHVREKATGEIWNLGEKALPSLQAATDAQDPEQAYRVRDLIRKIQLSITPETDPLVMSLIERYERGSTNDKMDLLNQMAKKRAWRQILKLYATDKNPELRARFQDSAKEYAVLAARECLLEGKSDKAREFLEMAPADAAGLIALADFHRSQGTLETELKRAKGIKGDNSQAWQLALHRAAGNLEAAREAAAAAGEMEIGAAMSVLLGDPLPWLRGDHANNGEGAVYRSYTSLAMKRWEGNEIRPADLESLTRALASRDPSNHKSAINALFLLGEVKLAEEALVKESPFTAFMHFESQDRIPEALKALGLDPENPDYSTWVKTRVEHLSRDDQEEDERGGSEVTLQLAIMANFLESRGLEKEAAAAYVEPLLSLAKKDAHAFTDFLGVLFGKKAVMGACPLLAKRIGLEWAGEDMIRWADLVAAAFGEEPESKELWDWLAELDAKATRIERLEGMLALLDIGSDPRRLREKWLSLAANAVKNAPAEKQAALNARIYYATAQLSRRNGDVKQALAAWDELPPANRNGISSDNIFITLSAGGRWEEAGAYFLKLISRFNDAKFEPRPDLYACAAGCLRQAGHLAEAATYDAWADKLALGNTEYALKISAAYSFCRDYARAEEWRNRAMRECDAAAGEFFVSEDGMTLVLQKVADTLLERGQWKQAAAINEVLAQGALVDSRTIQGVLMLRQRMQADMGRALSNLKDDRAGSIALLEKCHRLIPSDGSLADCFFPSLRKAGLLAEHDRWFDVSWKLITDVISRFPGSDNTCNTAGWLASRARLKLDLAEKLMEKAIAMNPEQSAYLDTMAEVQFSKGNRNKALEWSQLAINFWPQDAQLRHQNERFRKDPLPR